MVLWATQTHTGNKLIKAWSPCLDGHSNITFLECTCNMVPIWDLFKETRYFRSSCMTCLCIHLMLHIVLCNLYYTVYNEYITNFQRLHPIPVNDDEHQRLHGNHPHKPTRSSLGSRCSYTDPHTSPQTGNPRMLDPW